MFEKEKKQERRGGGGGGGVGEAVGGVLFVWCVVKEEGRLRGLMAVSVCMCVEEGRTPGSV